MRYFILAVFFVAISATAQDYKLDKVTVAELEEKQHPADSSAVAAVLFKMTTVYFEITNEGYWNVVTESEIKIKIYKKEGYKFGDFEKEYYTGSHSDKLGFTDAATYNLIDGKIEKTRIKNESVFKEDNRENYATKKLSFSNVREGSIIEFKSSHSTYSTAKLQDFYFQEEIPVNFASYRVTTPEFFEYNRGLGGTLTPDRHDVNVNNIAGGYQEYRVTFSMKDIKAMKDESYVNNINNYRSRILHELALKKNLRTPNENFATSWEAVAKSIYDNKDFGRQLDKTEYFEQDVDALLSGVTMPDEKIKLLFDYVQNKMSWNDYLGYACMEGVRTAYKSNVGNIAEINLILTSILRYAGFKANPIIASTRSNGVASLPSRTAFNYVLVGVEMGKEIVLLDASNKNSKPNTLPFRVLNGKGRIIRPDGTSEFVDLMPSRSSAELVQVVAAIDEEGQVQGEIKKVYSEHNAYIFRENYLGISKDSYIEKLEKEFMGVEISEYEAVNDRDLTKSVEEVYSFKHNNLTEIIGDRMYFSPMLFFAMQHNPFKQEEREYPVDFGYPYLNRFNVFITIPEGYTVESIPQPAMLQMNPNMGSFKYNISSNGHQIQFAAVYNINLAVIDSPYYESLKSFFGTMVLKQGEKIVLKKI